jgi:hypothetical protein
MERIKETEAGYKYDKLIFLSCFILVVILVISTMWLNKFDFSTNIYFECDQDRCPNPYYNMRDCQQEIKVLWAIPLYKTADCFAANPWSRQEFLTRGEYGKKPRGAFVLNNGYVIAFCLIAAAFIINHRRHNKGKQFDIEIPITKKLIVNRRTIKEWQQQK